jgi:hypothetical protein
MINSHRIEPHPGGQCTVPVLLEMNAEFRTSTTKEGRKLAERRDTITRAWRPKGAPARRPEDYIEVANVPRLVQVPEAPIPQEARSPRDIGLRLENWARWLTFIPGMRVNSSQTGAICERLRAAAEGDTSKSGERRVVDEADALRIERNMRYLTTQHRLLLWYCYLKQAHPGEVCRRLSIPQQPAAEFVAIFRAAQAAIEKLTEINL